MKNFEGLIEEKTEEINAVIERYLPKEEGYQKTVIEAMNYSVRAGGKRLRPMLSMETYRLFGGNHPVIEPFLAALEMVHTYSLVHDDLPAMDNDDFRRGRETTHVAYGHAMGILAGDGLLNYAFETAGKAFRLLTSEEMGGWLGNAVIRSQQILAESAGIYGMLGGQTADVEATEQKLPMTKERLDFIYRLKTGALIEASMRIGAVLSGASEKEEEKIAKTAGLSGMAFQIQDDILDVTGTMEALGKPVFSDEKNEKVTYVTLFGLEEAKNRVQELSGQAVNVLQSLPVKNEFLEELLMWLAHRKN